MTGYNFYRRAITERIGEIKYDIDRNEEQRKELMKELQEAKKTLVEIEANRDRYL